MNALAMAGPEDTLAPNNPIVVSAPARRPSTLCRLSNFPRLDTSAELNLGQRRTTIEIKALRHRHQVLLRLSFERRRQEPTGSLDDEELPGEGPATIVVQLLPEAAGTSRPSWTLIDEALA